MSKNNGKGETIELVRDCYSEGLTEPSLIAGAVGITPERVRQILRDLNLHKPRRNLRDVLQSLSHPLRKRLAKRARDLRFANESSATNDDSP